MISDIHYVQSFRYVNKNCLFSKWGGETYKFLHKLWLEGGYDVSAMPVYMLCRNNKEGCRPIWAQTVFGYQDLNEKQLAYLNKLYSGDYKLVTLKPLTHCDA